ncbi:preprotein translocase subunit YajC [Hymenobacter busanensis]|uniref:Sec translocon accessory complex subunit YajC n=1 Tax=Hymenobacter busanensis TaxID=2607656 RepID=A0A7L5A1Z6_9BACT|nr:preprotein translocase subunit YajC [Hymenobacter busanensis]KAA9331291.1 preprotein translocase subunit YajC [Hymenobacter busanensis]QHJ08442.1 preprotein translocase subunit YajC [Hymenobacter busanensis]
MLLTLLLQAQTENSPLQWLFPILLLGVFYFFMIRPQQKRAADAKKLREGLSKGTQVVTIGGLHGRIVELSDEKVTLEVDKGTRLTFDRSAIARQLGTPATQPVGEK